MGNSQTITQPLAAELGLPEAQGAGEGKLFSVARLLEWQRVCEERWEARRKKRVQSSFLPPEGPRGYGVARKEEDEI